MNKYKYILGVMAVGSLMVSCSDPLTVESPSSLEASFIYSEPNEQMADAAVMGIYEAIAHVNSYRGRFIPYFGTNTDCEIFNNYGGVADPSTDKEASLAVYSAAVDNTYMNTENNVYGKLYEGIERANLGIEAISANGNIENNENMRQLYGELLTLRGMMYFDLVKAWGDVPYRFEPVGNMPSPYVEKTDRVTILKKVMDDLLEAEACLGWPNENKYTVNVERVSKSFAKGLRARCAMFLAGYSQWPLTEGDHENSELRLNLTDAAERQEMYTIARDECASILNAGVHTFGTFEENFRALCQDEVSAGRESIYEIPFSEGRGRVLYTWGGKHNDADQWTKLAKGGVNGPTPTLWYDFDPQDVRRNITCLPYQWKGGIKVISGGSGGGWCFGKLRFEWMKRIVTSTNDDGINWQVMRLADVYMMAAEAENQLSGPSNAAKYLLPVMNRAYGSNKANALVAAASSQDKFQLLIEDERKFEFAGEAIRKVDLMRWGKLSIKLAETKQKMIDLANRTGIYAGYPQKVYYNEGLDAEPTDADGYVLYGLEKGQTDDDGKAAFALNTRLFCLTGDASSDNDTKITKMINSLYINDPNSRMFWPIWRYFITNSNNTLVNDYGYGE